MLMQTIMSPPDGAAISFAQENTNGSLQILSHLDPYFFVGDGGEVGC